MEIRRLQLENIGCFTTQTFEFSDLTVIYGENRTGKSTLVYALFFALFGEHLNSGLRITDLCRKGEKAGAAILNFRQNLSEYRIHQFTDRLPRLHERSAPDGEWQDVSLNDPARLKRYIPVAPDIASLGSFFRESELIYFLQDIPRYNKTLLQSLIGMDEALVLRSRFKKALGRAREMKRAIENAAPKKDPDPLNPELARRQLAAAENELREINAAYAASPPSDTQNPAVLNLLRQQYDEKKKQYDALLKSGENVPPIQELIEKKAAFEKKRDAEKEVAGLAGKLQRQIGEYIQKERHIRLRMSHLARLENRPTCPVCAQTVSAQRISALNSELKKLADKAARGQKAVESELKTLGERQKKAAEVRASLEQTYRQIEEVRSLDARITELREQLEGLASDLKQFESLGAGDLREAQARYQTRADLNARREHLQKEMVHQQVAIRQYEDHARRVRENRKHLEAAERKVLICDTAHEAVDESIQALGSMLLEKVRESIRTWTDLFTFLNRFDIQITDRELLPVIQARGYQYKLNQMSKSERIFLYLMLKLAIGDALGHLGAFILDDPADGLDPKRKQTLAYLLTEVSRKRQVIMTTNDMAFAELFPSAARIDLQES